MRRSAKAGTYAQLAESRTKGSTCTIAVGGVLRRIHSKATRSSGVTTTVHGKPAPSRRLAVSCALKTSIAEVGTAIAKATTAATTRGTRWRRDIAAIAAPSMATNAI